MQCRIAELRNKEVINVKNGVRIGFIGDAEIDTQTGRLTAVVVYGRLRLFGLLGREADLVILWKDITLLGDDAVLVRYEEAVEEKKKGAVSNFLEKISF